ncbi:hypothetical protein J437_LFUL002171 [Ladona fulva]|uniref:Erythroid differentiation-related factor 1 n=1 Tax=Ladona fulva TaxID=123851 RepID=A0A8K0JXR1_LADFU|nr:hypothetical protein J437_LFUL002171 [Ladona fulva]
MDIAMEVEEEHEVENDMNRLEINCDTSQNESESAEESPRPAMETRLHPIKSTAVVKYSASQSPAHFEKLQFNTDLNLPPSNWLKSSAEPYGLHFLPSHSTGFSSFKMAHMFPDCVGEVDVVSDAENIKKLLKIPYSRGPVSMMVHRIENTLLIDEFDIHKHLLITAKKEWEWLKNFFFNHVLASLDHKEKGLFQKNRTRGALQQRNLVSKFLYHSLASDSVQSPQHEENNATESNFDKIKHSRGSPDPVAVPSSEYPPLPEPREDEAVPDAVSNHNFTRNVVWTFEDIQMLIGTDMPIFGGSTHPCISLRLRDMSRPINVLTGIDYWLDNLMCNVPEVVMCYHLAGIVQRYELIKTEDLPHLPNSKFSPKLIRDVAQNILSFLKSNATKAGHTYWLFKGKDDDIVKLYDLTSLCTDVLDENGQNPFTVPVGMLLYRVARNMKHPKQNKRQQATVQRLLKNCIALLAKEKYPKIVASAHYMISDLYVPANVNPSSPNFGPKTPEKEDPDEMIINSQSEEEDLKDEDEKDGILQSQVSKTQDDCAEREVAVQSLCVSKKFKKSDNHRRRRNSKQSASTFEDVSVKDRCLMALSHVSSGLSCLEYLLTKDPSSEEYAKSNETGSSGSKKVFHEGEPKMACSYEAIPMPYARLRDEKLKTSPSKEESKAVQDEGAGDRNVEQKYAGVAEPWDAILRGLLYEKAALVFATLTEVEYNSGNFGMTLGMSICTLRCCRILESLRGENLKGVGGLVRGQQRKKGDAAEGRWDDLDELRACVLGRAGDAAFLVVKQWKQLEMIKEEFQKSFSLLENQMNVFIEESLGFEIYKKIESLPLTLREDWKSNTTTELQLIHFINEALNGTIEEMLLVSCCCYQQAFSLTRSSSHSKPPGRAGNQSAADIQRDTLLQRLGNIHNELGVLYSGKVEGNLMKEDAESDRTSTNNIQLSLLTFKELAYLSSDHFEAGIKAFSFIKDKPNMALLNSNYGRLLQLQAHRAGLGSGTLGVKKTNFTKQERMFYNKAIEAYQKAMNILETREEHPGIWDAVANRISSALFNYANHLSDSFGKHSGKVSDDLEEVIEAFKRALNACNVENDDIKSPFYNYRAALIHHRLAGLYYDKFRSLTSGSEGQDDHFKHYRKKGGGRDNIGRARGNISQRALQTTHQHYEKAAQLLIDLERPTEYLRVIIERVSLEEYIGDKADHKIQLSRVCDAIRHILGCKMILELLVERMEEKEKNDSSISVEKEESDDPTRLDKSKEETCSEESTKPSCPNDKDLDKTGKSDEKPISIEADETEEDEILELLQSLKGKLQANLLKLAQLSSSHFKQ